MPIITPSNPEAALVNLSLDAVALCNEGANSRAHIMLLKRKEKESMPKSFEELLKALTADEASLVTKHISDIETAKDEVIKGLNTKITELTGENETLKKAKPADQSEDILKSVSPEVKEMIEKLQTKVTSLVSEREEELAKARFAKVKALPVEEELLKSVLKSASPAVLSVLEKAAAAIEEGLAAKGKDTGDNFAITADDAYAMLEKSAKSIAAAEGITFEAAFTKAVETDPKSYNAYVNREYAKGAK